MTNDDTCMSYRDLLPAYGTGHLDAAERDLVERHLAGCARCRAEVAQWRTIGGALAETYRAIPPAPTQERLWQQVRSRLPETTTTNEIQPQLNGDHAIRRGMSAMTAETEELVFEDTPSHATPPRNPFSDPSQRRRSLPAIAATILVVALGIVLFAVMVPRHSNALTSDKKPTATVAATHKPLPTPNTVTTLQVTSDANSPAIVAPGDVWIGGDGYIAHYTDGKWTPFIFDGGTTIHIGGAFVRQLAMLSDNEGWAIGAIDGGSDAGALLLHYTSGTWQTINIADLTNDQLLGIQMFSATEGWTYSDHTLIHYVNRRWQKVSLGIDVNSQSICGLSFASSTEGWLGACSNSGLQLWHFHDGRWTSGPTFPKVELAGISITSATEGWASTLQLNTGARLSAIGPSAPTILHYHNGQWAEENPAPNVLTPQQYNMEGIFLRDSQEGWAVLFATNANDTTTATLHLSNGHWSFVPLPPHIWVEGFLSVKPNEAWAAGQSLGVTGQDPNPEHAVVLHYLNGKWTLVNPA
jgi:anti-sigma factor RsiW